MREGRDVVRLFDRKSLKWTTLPGVKLSEYRWYPTQARGGAVARRFIWVHGAAQCRSPHFGPALSCDVPSPPNPKHPTKSNSALRDPNHHSPHPAEARKALPALTHPGPPNTPPDPR